MWLEQEIDLLVHGIGFLPPHRFQQVDITLPWYYGYFGLLIPVPEISANYAAIFKPFQWPVIILAPSNKNSRLFLDCQEAIRNKTQVTELKSHIRMRNSCWVLIIIWTVNKVNSVILYLYKVWMLIAMSIICIAILLSQLLHMHFLEENNSSLSTKTYSRSKGLDEKLLSRRIKQPDNSIRNTGRNAKSQFLYAFGLLLSQGKKNQKRIIHIFF